MSRSTVHYADNETNNILKRLHNKLRPAGTPVERVEYIIELLLLRIFEAKLKQDEIFSPLRKLFEGENYRLLFSHLLSLNGEQILSELNQNIFPFYASIISKARVVISDNLPQKMQDQLVLMEEVFANSNFTNNVKGGVIAEVVGLVNEIEERWILKTDLLGDAIESALSETGGTKDLGLYRTPDHIRKMMVEMVDPDFTDTIFDPACGTAGFLFDAYDYVIDKAKRTRYFPAGNIANQFYRTGIGGIEYQGRIRKMAAVNMYIRGLNPHNIEQGDSLKIFDPTKDANSKSVVISNPPFGAERDQPAYPNVWEEYSKESETTILFVKLIFDLLKQFGRCAVVVSEGFLTWGQNSAIALRKLLLSEANLRAVISLPQGVFVSKSGQGAKTSILYFEKGAPTEFVWFYKIENDGYSLGTNRKPISGSQIPELLELFNEVKKGNKPKATNYSFYVSKEQIETLDPRVAERIRNDVRDKVIERNQNKKEKLVLELNSKLTSKTISKDLYNEKLWQFDNIVEGQVENEIAKAIERAHSYHFNLQSYRSPLSEQQIKEWHGVLENIDAKNGTSIESRYKELQVADPTKILQILASFDPENALQLDIAREFLTKLDKGLLAEDNRLQRLYEITKESNKYPFESLKNLLIPKVEKIKLEDKISYKQVTIKLHGKGVILRQEILGEAVRTEGQYVVSAGDFIMSKIDARNGAFGIVPKELDGAVVTSSFPYFEVNTELADPKYLEAIITQKNFYDQINGMVSGATGRRSVEVNDFLELQIPLPPREIQEDIVDRIQDQKHVIAGADKILDTWKVDIPISINDFERVEIGSLVLTSQYGTSKKADYQDTGYPVLRIGNIGFCKFNLTDIKKVDLDDTEFKKLRLNKDDFLIVRSNGNPDLVGKCAVWDGDGDYVYASYLIRFIFDTNKINPRFAMYCLMSPEGRAQLNPKQGGGTYNINSEEFRQFMIPFPPLPLQNQVVEKLNRQMEALEGVGLLKKEAQKRIEEILTVVWGEDDGSMKESNLVSDKIGDKENSF
jgi:type I restriction-modification system DNA methylase subunit/restriction endonuclease S subunit